MTNCSVIQIKYSKSFIESVNSSSCICNTSMKVCKGQITAYYNGKTFPKYINYTLGVIDDTAENENDVITHGLLNLTKYQVYVNATTKETIIKADIYCTYRNQCALFEIKQLFDKYNNQINPFYELKSLFYVNPPPKKLTCYDITIKENRQCLISENNSVCLSYLKDLKQECSFQSNLHIYEEFLITSPHDYELYRMSDSVICNKDNCNSNEILAKIQNIAKRYAYGTVIRKNTANRQQPEISQIFRVFLFLILSRMSR